jgi:hypothetical protein
MFDTQRVLPRWPFTRKHIFRGVWYHFRNGHPYRILAMRDSVAIPVPHHDPDLVLRGLYTSVTDRELEVWLWKRSGHYRAVIYELGGKEFDYASEPVVIYTDVSSRLDKDNLFIRPLHGPKGFFTFEHTNGRTVDRFSRNRTTAVVTRL